MSLWDRLKGSTTSEESKNLWAVLQKGYNPGQPRHPKGTELGGQWVSTGRGSGSKGKGGFFAGTTGMIGWDAGPVKTTDTPEPMKPLPPKPKIGGSEKNQVWWNKKLDKIEENYKKSLGALESGEYNPSAYLALHEPPKSAPKSVHEYFQAAKTNFILAQVSKNAGHAPVQSAVSQAAVRAKPAPAMIMPVKPLVGTPGGKHEIYWTKKANAIEEAALSGDPAALAKVKPPKTAPPAIKKYYDDIVAAKDNALASKQPDIPQKTSTSAPINTVKTTGTPTIGDLQKFAEANGTDLAIVGKGGKMVPFQKVGGQLGSNPGGIYVAPNGSKFYVKFQKSEAHALNETLASRLYSLTGTEATHVFNVKSNKGPTTSTLWKDDLKQIDPLNNLSHRTAVSENFGAHVWLGNWDAVGLTFDNQKINPSTGKAMTVDSGGSMFFRAQGNPKKFTGDVAELKSFLDSSVNPNTAMMFSGDGPGGMNQTAFDSLGKIASLSSADIEKIVNAYAPDGIPGQSTKQELINTLIARRDKIASFYATEKAVAKVKNSQALKDAGIVPKVSSAASNAGFAPLSAGAMNVTKTTDSLGKPAVEYQGHIFSLGASGTPIPPNMPYSPAAADKMIAMKNAFFMNDVPKAKQLLDEMMQDNILPKAAKEKIQAYAYALESTSGLGFVDLQPSGSSFGGFSGKQADYLAAAKVLANSGNTFSLADLSNNVVLDSDLSAKQKNDVLDYIAAAKAAKRVGLPVPEPGTTFAQVKAQINPPPKTLFDKPVSAMGLSEIKALQPGTVASVPALSGHAYEMMKLADANDIHGLKNYFVSDLQEYKTVNYQAYKDFKEFKKSLESKVESRIINQDSSKTSKKLLPAEQILASLSDFPPSVQASQVKTWHDKVYGYLKIGDNDSIPKNLHETFKAVDPQSPEGKKLFSKLGKSYASFDFKENKVLENYKGAGYQNINTMLRTGKPYFSGIQGVTPQKILSRAERLRRMIEDKGVDLPEGIILHRGVDLPGGGPVAFSIMNQNIGSILQEPGFVSTSWGSKAAFQEKNTQLRIHISKGVKGIAAKANTKDDYEREIVLPPGIRYLVTGVSQSGSKTTVDVIALPGSVGKIADLIDDDI